GHVYAACKGWTSTTGGLQKSTDGGATWTRVIGSGSTDMHVADLEEAPNGDLYATVGIFTTGKIFKSTYATHTTNVGNSGNWTNITPTGNWQRIELAVAPSNASQLYAVCQGTGYEVTGIYSSIDGGANWTSKTIPDIYDQGNSSPFTRGQSWYDLMCTVDPATSTTVYIGGVDMLRSTNSGTSWTQLTSWSLYNDPFNPLTPFPWLAAQNVHADIHALVFKPGTNTTALVASDGGLAYSTDLTSAVGLPTWASKSTNYNVTQYYACATHPTNSNYFLAGAQDNGSHKFTTIGINAVTEVSGGDGAFCFIDKTNGNNQITSYVRNHYYVSTNGGTSFNYVSGGNSSGRFINPSDLDATNGILYSAGTTDEVVIWWDIFGVFGPTRYNEYVNLNGEQISAIKVSPNNPNIVYLGTGNGRIYRLTNITTVPTFTNLTSSALVSNGYVSSIDVKKRATNTDDSILVAISNYGVNSVYYTANGTTSSPTWVDIDDNNTLQDIPVRWAVWSPASSKIVFLGTEVGVLGTGTLNGNSTNWTLLNNGIFPSVRVDMLQVNSNNQLVAATHGRGLWTSGDVTPLSLRLLAFDIKKLTHKIAIEWKVENDREAKNYTVERCYDGKDFETVATVAPKGSNSYSTFDISFDNRKNRISYRLKVEDINGEVYYSGVRTVRLSGDVNFIEQIYPTVTRSSINIRTGNAGSKQMQVQIIDALGKIYMKKVMPYAPATLDLQQLVPGNYLLYITDETGSEKYFSRIVLQ
ncbi:MAG TPA: T9SS type A sorting domain-containing protein, partial [Flavipsychrobacter sp.]|nr:T9SS type A sorting domain-containing protein [Flavipsychrobacter sp.]